MAALPAGWRAYLIAHPTWNQGDRVALLRFGQTDRIATDAVACRVMSQSIAETVDTAACRPVHAPRDGRRGRALRTGRASEGRPPTGIAPGTAFGRVSPICRSSMDLDRRSAMVLHCDPTPRTYTCSWRQSNQRERSRRGTVGPSMTVVPAHAAAPTPRSPDRTGCPRPQTSSRSVETLGLKAT